MLRRRFHSAFRIPHSALVLVVVLTLTTFSWGQGTSTKYLKNICYSKVGDKELKLDLACPEGKGPYPAVVCIHGGGFRAGTRDADGYVKYRKHAAKKTNLVDYDKRIKDKYWA